MRVTQLEISRNLLTDLEKINRNFVDVNRQLSSGKKLSFLGDSPIGNADLVDITERALRLDAYRFNTTASSYQLKSAEAALNAVYNAFVSIHTLGMTAANEPTNTQGRKAVLSEITILRDELISRGNTQVDGLYIFAGTSVKTLPFTINNTTPTGRVEYNGSDKVNSIPVSDGVDVISGVSGKNAMGAVLEAVDLLMEKIQNSIDGTGGIDEISKALNFFGDALIELNDARGQVGVSLSMVERMAAMIDTRNTILTEQKSKIEDANILEVTMRISQLQTAINAAMSSGGAILKQNNLFDIIG